MLFRKPNPDENKKITVESSVKIPLASEELEVGKKTFETGKVRVKKIVHEHEELIDQPLLREEVEVKRVNIDRMIEQPISSRYEGDLLIVPVLEEVMVVKKQWILKEELHIRKHFVEVHKPQRVTLRSEEAFVERESQPEKPD